MPGEGGFDLRSQRLPLLGALCLVGTLVLYYYIIDILVLLLLAVAFWYAYDFIRDFTKQVVDPTGKYVFITGCDSGFGLESAKALRDLGFGVIAGVYDDNSKGAVELRNRPWVKKVEVVSLDVTNEASVQACAKEVKEICQDAGLWAVINNAGIFYMGETELVSMEMYHRCNEVNLFGAIRVTKSVLPLIRQAQGRIVNVTSERGFNPWKGGSPYCVSKFGLEAFSAVLRREMEEFKVKVITVAPGTFSGATGIHAERLTDQLVDGLLKGHANLSLQDQNQAYPREKITSHKDTIQAAIQASCPTMEPVVKAYIDAVHNTDPSRCYFVHGFKRKCLDPAIIMCRLRPFIPEKVVQYVEKILYSILG